LYNFLSYLETFYQDLLTLYIYASQAFLNMLF